MIHRLHLVEHEPHLCIHLRDDSVLLHVKWSYLVLSCRQSPSQGVPFFGVRLYNPPSASKALTHLKKSAVRGIIPRGRLRSQQIRF